MVPGRELLAETSRFLYVHIVVGRYAPFTIVFYEYLLQSCANFAIDRALYAGWHALKSAQFGRDIDDGYVRSHETNLAYRHGEFAALEKRFEDFGVPILEGSMPIKYSSTDVGETPVFGESQRKSLCIADVPGLNLLGDDLTNARFIVV
jgi:hypothetical protein